MFSLLHLAVRQPTLTYYTWDLLQAGSVLTKVTLLTVRKYLIQPHFKTILPLISSMDGGTITSSGFPSSWFSGFQITCRVPLCSGNGGTSGLHGWLINTAHNLPWASSRSFGIDLLTDCAFSSLRLRFSDMKFSRNNCVTCFDHLWSILMYHTLSFKMFYCEITM